MVRTIHIFALLAGVILFCVPPTWAQGITELSDPAFGQGQRPPAVFEHDAHNIQAGLSNCRVCHHLYRQGQLVQDQDSLGQPCSSCHPVQPRGSELPLLKAYHGQCIDCHEREDKGPLACGHCHVK